MSNDLYSDSSTLVEYAVRTMMKGKTPTTAAKATAKKFHGSENFFLGKGVLHIDAKALEEALWVRLMKFTLKNLLSIKPGMEHFALSGTILHFEQGPSVRKELKRRIIEGVGRDPFPNDDGK